QASQRKPRRLLCLTGDWDPPRRVPITRPTFHIFCANGRPLPLPVFFPRRYHPRPMPKITVDGKTIEAKDRQMILQACGDANIPVPQYCYHPGLSIPASCRICLVEVEGIPKLVPACQTPVRDGMVVQTKSSKAIANQKQVMEYLLINHPLDCPVCDQAGECFLQDYSYQHGRAQSRFEEDKQ